MNKDKEGIHPIANTINAQRLADIVFVHGLMGSSHATWTHKSEGHSDYFFWPEELGRAFPNCGIWSVGYGAGLTEMGQAGMLIQKRAQNLVSQLCVKGLGQKPVIFICHSMGGLVVKALAVSGATPMDHEHSRLVKNIRGILFCGTPHRGSALASFASFLGVAQKHVKQMRANDEALDLDHQRFVNWHKSNPIRVLTFAESHPMKRKTRFGALLPRVMIVQRASASFDMGPVHDVEADHLSLVKPKRGDFVSEKSQEWIAEILEFSDLASCQIAPTQVDQSAVTDGGITQQAHYSEIYSEFSAEKEVTFQTILNQLTEGHYAEAETAVRGEMAKRSVWKSLHSATKAKAHRLLINAVLNRQLKTDEAKKLLWEAKSECPNERFVTTEAFIAITDGSEKAMLESFPTPVSEEEWRWKLLLFVNDQQYEEAIRSALDPAAPYLPSPAVHGVLCWAYLGLKRIEDAKRSNEIALNERPNDLGNLEAKALISFASATSPAASHWLELGFPQPIEPECLLNTPTAFQQFTEARKIFDDLAERMDEGSLKHLKYLSWSLAAYCCIIRVSPKQDMQLIKGALKVFENIQKHHPYFPLAIHWVLQARLPIDLAHAEGLLRRGVTEKKSEALEALLQIYLHQNKHLEAVELLDSHKSQYIKLQGQRAWRYYRIQLAGVLEQKHVCEQMLNEAEDEEDRLRLFTLSMKGPKTSGESRKEYLNAHIALWRHTQKVTDLFDACEAHAESGAPEFVAEHRVELLKNLPTRKTLFLVLNSLNNVHEWQLCLDTIKTNRDLFQGSQSTPFLFVEFEALYQTGKFTQALAIIRQVTQLHPNEQNIYLWFDRAARAGNHEHMAEASQFATQTLSSSSELLLHMSEHLVDIHPELARQLFDLATSSPQIRNPQAAAKAFLLSHRLGVTDLAPEVIHAALSPAGPAKALTFEQTVELMQQHKKERAEQEEHYRLGNVFVHAFANSTSYPISAIYYDACPPANADYFAPPTRLWSAGIRHGRRFQFDPIPQDTPWKLYLDVSSLLLAHRLGILSVLEKTDAVLSISKLVPGLLLKELKQLNERQPSREMEVDHLLALIDAGKIRVTSQAQTELLGMTNGDAPWAVGMYQDWRQAFSKAVEEEGVLIDFWPLDWESDHRRPLEVPEQWRGNVGGPSGLLQGMIDAGWIDESEFSSKIKNHDTFIPASPTLRLTDGKSIFLDLGVARVLVGIGILDTLVSRCKVWLTYGGERECRESKKQALYRGEISSNIESLQKHLQAELGRRYLAGPASTHEGKHKNDSLLFLSLLDLTAASRIDDVILIAEDRWLTGFLHVDKAPIVGLLDVMYWFHKKHKITASTFYGCLHRLRLGNARFIPITIEELLFRLKGATNLHTLELHETPELEVIRRYYAACFLDAKSLQFGGVEDIERSELRFLANITHVTASALAYLWMEEDNYVIREAKGGWILHALLADINLAIQVANPNAITDLNERCLEDLFCFFCAQACIIRQTDNLQTCVGDFANWLIKTLNLHSSVFGRFYAAIENLFFRRMDAEDERETSRASLLLFNEMVMGLLKAGRHHFTVPTDVKRQLGIITITSLGELGFERNEFWNAIELAMAGQSTLIRSQNEKKKEYRVAKREDEDGAVRIVFDDGSENSPVFVTELLSLLAPVEDDRLEFLVSQRTNLDLTPQFSASVFNSICKAESPADRIDLYCQLEDASTTIQFKRFLEKHRKSSVNFQHIDDELRPLGVTALLQHICLMPGDLAKSDFTELLVVSSLRLIDDHGLCAAFVRLGSLPVALPDLWAERLFSLTADEVARFVDEFDHPTASPLLRFQLATLLVRPESIYKERGMLILADLIGVEAKDSWGFFRAVLHWSWRCLVSREEDFPENEMILCAWLHAGVFQHCLHRPTESPGVIRSFNQLVNTTTRIFDPINERLDLAHPLHFSAKWMLAHALPKQIALDTLPQVVAQTLKDKYQAMLFAEETKGQPDESVMVLRGEWTNSLSSFLEPCSSKHFKDWVTEAQESWLDQQVFATAMQDYCQDLDRVGSLNEWTFFSHLSSHRVAPQSFRQALILQLDRFDFAKLDSKHELASAALWACAHFIALQRAWYRTDDEEYWFNFLNNFLNAIEKHQEKKFSEYAVDCAWAINSAWSDPVKCAKGFADTVIRMVRPRPTIATDTWTSLSSIVQSQKHHVQMHLWPMLAEVRAVAGRTEM